jgi:hypothetical protein
MVGGDFLSRPRPCMGCSAWGGASEWVSELWNQVWYVMPCHWFSGFQRNVLSLCSLSYDRSSKPSSPKSAIWCFLFLHPVSAHLLTIIQQPCLLPHFPVTSIPSFYLSLNNMFRRQYQCKILSVQLFFLLFIVCRMFLSSLTKKCKASEMSETIHQMTQHRIPEGWNPHFSYLYHKVQKIYSTQK